MHEFPVTRKNTPTRVTVAPKDAHAQGMTWFRGGARRQ